MSHPSTLYPFGELSLQNDVGDHGIDKSQTKSGSKETASWISLHMTRDSCVGLCDLRWPREVSQIFEVFP